MRVRVVQPAIGPTYDESSKVPGAGRKKLGSSNSGFGLHNVQPMRSFRSKSWSIVFITCGNV